MSKRALIIWYITKVEFPGGLLTALYMCCRQERRAAFLFPAMGKAGKVEKKGGGFWLFCNELHFGLSPEKPLNTGFTDSLVE